MSVILTVDKNIHYLRIKWDAPFDLGGGHITKYEIVMNTTSLETGLLHNTWSKDFDAKKYPRSYTIKIPAFTRSTIWVREGGGDSPIWGPYNKPIEISTPQGGTTKKVIFIIIILFYLFYIKYLFENLIVTKILALGNVNHVFTS